MITTLIMLPDLFVMCPRLILMPGLFVMCPWLIMMADRLVMCARLTLNDMNRLLLVGNNCAGNGAQDRAENSALDSLIMAGSDNCARCCTDNGARAHGAILIGCRLGSRGDK